METQTDRAEESGERAASEASTLGPDRAFALFRSIRTALMLTDRLGGMVDDGTIPFWPSEPARIAATLTALAGLADDDFLFATMRDWAAPLARGLAPEAIFHRALATSRDPLAGRDVSAGYSYKALRIGSASAPTATHLPHAVGVAWAAKQRGDALVSAAFFDAREVDGADFHTGLNFAGVMKTATVFVCFVGNGEPGSAEHAVAYGLPHASCDGSDPEATVRTIATARERAASGGGATVVDVKVGDDAASVTRRLAAVLERAGSWTEAAERDLAQTIGRQLDEALRVARASGSAKASAMFEQVFAELPPHLVAQRSSSERSSSERSSSERDRRK
ncbi:MAG: thiamine pyrophosphate-dependent enzyme [Sandaracinaceae bacterium]